MVPTRSRSSFGLLPTSVESLVCQWLFRPASSETRLIAGDQIGKSIGKPTPCPLTQFCHGREVEGVTIKNPFR